MNAWKKERCSRQPEELQLIAKGLYMQRRNIKKVEHEAEDERENYSEWICESREIEESELNLLNAIEEIKTEEAIDEYTQQLMEEGIL